MTAARRPFLLARPFLCQPTARLTRAAALPPQPFTPWRDIFYFLSTAKNAPLTPLLVWRLESCRLRALSKRVNDIARAFPDALLLHIRSVQRLCAVVPLSYILYGAGVSSPFIFNYLHKELDSR